LALLTFDSYLEGIMEGEIMEGVAVGACQEEEFEIH
jgi:hypothetical protein